MKIESVYIEKKVGVLDGATVTDDGYLSGYASIKGSVDAYGDTIVDGAYVDVPALIKNGFVTIGHKLNDLPVGYIVDAREDERGLWVKMAWHNTTEAQETRKVVTERLAAGKSQGLSIDYRTLESMQGSGDARRILQKIEVKGFAIVNLPAESQATVLDAKAGPGTPFVDQFEQVLESVADWTKRAEDLHALRKNGLSEPHLQRVGELKAALTLLEGGLQGEPETPSDPVSDDHLEAILEMEAFYGQLEKE